MTNAKKVETAVADNRIIDDRKHDQHTNLILPMTVNVHSHQSKIYPIIRYQIIILKVRTLGGQKSLKVTALPFDLDEKGNRLTRKGKPLSCTICRNNHFDFEHDELFKLGYTGSTPAHLNKALFEKRKTDNTAYFPQYPSAIKPEN